MRVISDPFALDPYISRSLGFREVPYRRRMPRLRFFFIPGHAPMPLFFVPGRTPMAYFICPVGAAYVPDGSMQAPINSHTSLR